MRTVVTGLDLSMIVSVLTSRQPMDLGSMSYLLRWLEMAKEHH